MAWTKEQKAEYNKRYKAEHKEEISQYNKQYSQTNNADIKTRHKSYRETHKEVRNKQTAQWKQDNSERVTEYNKKYQPKYHKEYSQREGYSRRKRNEKLLRLYGIGIDEYEILFDNQNGCCAICGKSANGKSLYVDHDHVTGKVRKLLCQKCNSGIGMLQDDIGILERALNYLKSFR